MNIAVIGLGDIAQKAYLPVYAQYPDVSVYLVSRDEAKRDRLNAQYRFAGTFASIHEVPTSTIDAVMIHSSTAVHAEQVEFFLKRGVHVFIDKPIAFTIEETERLVRLADESGVSLVTGFNRRFATATRALAEVEGKNMVLIQKNRTYGKATVREFVVEDFIHVADTLRHLTNRQPIEDLIVTPTFEASVLKQLLIQFRAGGVLAIGMMNRDNGCTEEVMEVMSPQLKRVSRNVERVYDFTSVGMMERVDSPWEPTLQRRGFVAMLDAFFDTVRGKDSASVLGADSLETHRLVERIMSEIERHGVVSP